MSQNAVEEAVVPQSHADQEEPEGQDGRAAPSPPGWLSQVPYFLVLATMASGIVIVAAAYFKRGPALIAGALLLGAVLRAFLPPEKVGMLAVRNRWLDVVTLSTLAVLLVVLAWVAPQLTD